MSLVAEEIRDQPRAWARAADLAAAIPHAFPGGERIAVIGCGSSWHAAKAVAALRELGGHGETDAFAASEARLGRRYDRVVAISRSGATTEIRRALELVAPATTTVAMVGDPLSPVATGCDLVVDMSFADDRSVVQTRFVTTAVCFARASLGVGIEDLVAEAELALSESHPLDPAAIDRAVVLGRDWRVGLAEAGALALRETARVWAEAYPAMEYRHGPIATAGPGALVWLLDPPPSKLAEEVAATGAAVHVASLDPLAELVRIQRLAVALAEQRGLDPDRPANLERAVVLDLIESGKLVRRAERLDGILDRLASDGSVSVRELTETLGASSATVRRDLALLEQQKLLSRSHGGAVSNGLLYELPVRYRGGRRAEEKSRIAAAAAERIADAQTVGLTGGTTTTEVARRLRDRTLTVVTNAVNIASELVISEKIRLVVTGGVARPQSYELIGPLAERALDGLNVDVTFLGVDGVNASGATTHDEIEAQTDRRMVERSDRVIVVCDSSKIGRSALSAICALSDIDELITDVDAPAEHVEALRVAGVKVVQV